MKTRTLSDIEAGISAEIRKGSDFYVVQIKREMSLFDHETGLIDTVNIFPLLETSENQYLAELKEPWDMTAEEFSEKYIFLENDEIEMGRMHNQ